TATLPVASAERTGIDWQLFGRLYRMTDRYAVVRRTVFITSFVRAFQRPAQFWALTAIINGPIAAHDFRTTMLWTAGFVCLTISTAIVLHFRSFNQNSLGEALVHDLRNEIFCNLQKQPLSFYHKTKLGRILSHFVTDLEAVRRGIQLFVFIAQEFVQLLFCGALMAYYNWVLFLVILAFAPVLVWANRYFQPRIHKSSRIAAESGSRLTGHLAESVRGMRVIQGFARQGRGEEAFGVQADRLAEDNVSFATESALYAPVFGITGQAFLAALLIVGGYGALHGFARMDIDSLVAFFFLPASFFLSVQAAASYYPNILASQVGAERVLRLIDLTPAWSDAEGAVELPDPRNVSSTSFA
ncbi:MAG TPA: ABC transporter ATP-binding protein, partial [Opitutaceae bacterium]